MTRQNSPSFSLFFLCETLVSFPPVQYWLLLPKLGSCIGRPNRARCKPNKPKTYCHKRLFCQFAVGLQNSSRSRLSIPARLFKRRPRSRLRRPPIRFVASRHFDSRSRRLDDFGIRAGSCRLQQTSATSGRVNRRHNSTFILLARTCGFPERPTLRLL